MPSRVVSPTLDMRQQKSLDERYQDVKETVQAMKRQEAQYHCCSGDYLKETVVDEASRQQICEWMFVVVDHYEIARDVAATGIYLLDLYTSRNTAAVKTQVDFQLAAMACLFLAFKVHGHAHEKDGIALETLVKLSRGLFTVDQVRVMELQILFALKWKVHPPTPSCYLALYLQLLPSSICRSTRYKIAEVARFLLEMSLCVYSVTSQYPPSVISYAALLIAMDDVDYITIQQCESFFQRMSCVAGIRHTSGKVGSVAYDLQQLLLEQDTDVKTLLESLDQRYEEHHQQCQAALVEKETNRQENSSSPREVLGTEFVTD